MVITKVQNDLLIGTLLGDGNCQTQTSGNTWRYRAVQKLAHQPYIFHKWEIMQNYCQSSPVLSTVVDTRTNKKYSRYTFQTIVADEFRYYGTLFYQKQEDQSWVKRVPPNIASLLTPQAFAYWYMDDGALKWKGKSNAVRLCTDSFTTNDINLLKKVLETKYSLKVSLQKKDSIQRLCILEESYPILKDIIEPWLIPCMYYKFPDGNKGVFQGQDISNDIRNRLDVPKDENPEF